MEKKVHFMLCMCQLSLHRSAEYGGTPAPSFQMLLFILLWLGQRSLTLDARRILLQVSLVLKCSPIPYMDFLVRLLLSELAFIALRIPMAPGTC